MQLTKTRLDRDARRELILDVAQEVFLEEGFSAASMSFVPGNFLSTNVR